MMSIKKKSGKQVGVIGTGFISRGFTLAMEHYPDLALSRILTRRDISSCGEFPRKDLLTNSVAELIDHSDIIVECSGDVIHATDVIDQVLKASLPVVTMDAEFHVTVGSYFVNKGLISEAEGDQPGCQAALHENVTAMGFKPLAYINVKGFHNPDPTLEEMRFWSKKQNLSLPMVISATDGTKMQFEQVLVANCFGATILKDGLLGEIGQDVSTIAFHLADAAKKLGQPVSDYTVNATPPFRICIVAEYDSRQKAALDYYKFGPGPYYILPQNIMLCHLEIAKTIRRLLAGGKPLLDNSSHPAMSMAAVAKKCLPMGTPIKFGCGCFELRGLAVKINEHFGHIPIGLVQDAVIKRNIEPGQILSLNDVGIPDSLALKAWRQIEATAKGAATLSGKT